MERMKMKTPNLADSNFATLAAMFPNAVTETITGYDENGVPIIERAIDAEVLAQEINTRVVSGKEERYQFTWPDKKKSILLANTPIAASLRPVRGDEPAVMKDGDKEIPYTRTGSVNFDDTENLYIEGDNLDVLKLLRETYLNRVKMIYIDPPYNTGKDFVYEDDFAEETGEFLRRDVQYDEQGNRLTPNLDSNGRFHTDWLNMMYPRLRIARDLLADDGVIFMSIDDNEVENLKKVCNEVFGGVNFIACLVWEKKKKGAFLSKHYINMKEYLLVFAKNASSFSGLVGELNSDSETYPCIKTTNARGTRMIKAGTVSKYKDKDYVVVENTRISSGNMELIYLDKAVIKDGVLQNDVLIDSNWIYSQSALDGFAKDGLIYITQDLYIRRIVNEERTKMLKDLLLRVGSDGQSLSTYKFDLNLNNGGWGTNEDANDELHQLLGQQYLFDFTKPSRLIAKIIQSENDRNAIILDFFSGSSTTANAVMQLNAEDDGNRKFIMVQLPEICAEGSEAYKADYKNICEIGKERIRRAGKKIIEENKDKPGIENLDIGFRVLKLDSSNMKDVYYTPKKYAQINFDLEGFMDNIKPDRTEEDLLFQVMLDLGIPLSAKITQEGNIFYVNDNYLIACFGRVDTALITEIAKKQPYYVVFRDSSFSDDSAMVNFEQVFSTYSPTTIRRVL